MFIPDNINGCLFSYNNDVYQFHYDAEENIISFESYSATEPADDIDLLKRLVELSEKAFK